MASPILPGARAALVDSKGVTTPEFYRYLRSMTTVAGITPDLQAQIQALTDLINGGGAFLPITANVRGFGAIASFGTLRGGTVNLDLRATGVTAGTYGDAGKMPVLTIDGQGRITDASEVLAESAKRAITGLFVNSAGTPLTGTIDGTPVFVPYDFTILGWFLGGDGITTGSGTIDVQSSSDQAAWSSITGSVVPEVTGASSGSGTALTGWTVAFTGGIWLRFVGSGFANWSAASFILSVSTP